jgi:hypothetical protein
MNYTKAQLMKFSKEVLVDYGLDTPLFQIEFGALKNLLLIPKLTN